MYVKEGKRDSRPLPHAHSLPFCSASAGRQGCAMPSTFRAAAIEQARQRVGAFIPMYSQDTIAQSTPHVKWKESKKHRGGGVGGGNQNRVMLRVKANTDTYAHMHSRT